MAKTVTERLEAARKRTLDRGREVTYLLAILTRKSWRKRAHLAPVVEPHADEQWNYVVCVHDRNEAMAWRLSDEDAAAYFGHLGPATSCEHGEVTRDEKMERLEALARL